MAEYKSFKNLKIDDLGDFVFKVSLNRPRKYNALNLDIWFEIGDVFKKLDADSNCRCIILEGEGKHFTTGLDLTEVTGAHGDEDVDHARRGRRLFPLIKKMQQSFTEIENCTKPVLVGIHGYCLGGGIDIITATDVRVATKDSIFSVKEVDIGMAADVGTLNRLPKCVGNQSWVKDISITARHFGADEALNFGLISRVFSTREEMQTELLKMAKLICTKSPVGVQGTKVVLNYSRDHTVQDSLNYVATWNMSQLFTEDMMKAGMAIMTKEPLPPFSKL
ncbi:unnamed protein product [Caenorhabditis angaria]|uniref:Delta(3,5)-Delta(2,4)-dienoyl-CoA isomerase, mitochondrial n=1 Tax=Caenorhabditis angaria TaxID=860376 RepID=A0A9P1I8R8_9PELO|nr:unnamed protein product [Caenorhabditis angaria]